mgnify:CR=1 FL=1
MPYAVAMAFSTWWSSSTNGPLAVSLLALAVLGATRAPAAEVDALPPLFARFLDEAVHPSQGDRRRLAAGGPVTKLLTSDASEQVSVFGAIWIAAPPQRYVEAIRDIESWERGKAFRITRRVGRPPQLDDFAGARLTPALVSDLRNCRVGDCEIKLDEAAIDAFHTRIDWTSADRHAEAERMMRHVLYDYTTAYLAGGNSRLPMLRDKGTPISMGDEFRAMVDDMPLLATYMPDVHRYLIGFPRVWLPGASSFVYWQETEFGLKPTIRISHLTIRERPEDVVVASKMIYANHYFRSALELRVLLPDPARGPGFWFVTVMSSRTDGMTGFTGLFVRRRVRNEAREATGTVLVNTKRRIETGQP